MAETLGSAGREVGVGKSTILRLIRPSAPASNPETAALRAECEGLRLALSLAEDALREERSDKQHWRDEAKYLRGLLAPKRESEIILAAPEIVPPAPTPEPNVVEALAPVAEAEPDRLSAEMEPAQSAAPPPRYRWWGRLTHLRGLLAPKRESEIILAAPEIVPPAPTPEPNVVEALAPVAEAEPDRLSTEMEPAQSAAPAPRYRWWGRLTHQV
jgi:hypothetical protein